MIRGPVVVGRRPVVEAIRAGLAREVLVAEGASNQGLGAVLDAARAAAVPVTRVPVEEIKSLAAGTPHQRVAARVAQPGTLGEGDLAARSWAEDAVAVILDGVTDPHNLGAVARTAEAAGAAVLITRRHRAAGLTPAAVKASAGALLRLPVAHVANITRAVERLKESGFWAVGLDGGAPETLDRAERPPGRLALILGAEGQGMSRLVRESCDQLLAIPMRGEVASLNVSVAAGVALFAFALPGGGPEAEKQG
ncbi:MAG TPA: 23S rRNA (guanosine(2251)-2'-O)-methyltransferase RlmB [Actinomycetota bacterium]